MRPKILIISSGNPCRNPRPVKEATALGEAGFDVTLLSPSAIPALVPIDRELTAGAPYRHEAVVLESNSAAGGQRKLRSWLGRKLVHLGWETVDALGASQPLGRRAAAIAADLTIVHNEVPFWIGCQLLRQGRRVAADFEDWHSEDLLPEARRDRPLRLLRQIEGELMRLAVYKSTTSLALGQALAARYGGEAPKVLPNSFPLQPDPHAGPSNRPPAFFWYSQTLGAGRGLELFRDAWIRTHQPSRLVLLGESWGGFEENFLTSLPADFRNRVTFLALVAPAALPSLIAQHDIGLALEQSFIVNRDLTITNKILQYLNAGLAVVASDTAGQREVLARAIGAGIIVNLPDPAETAQQLDALLSEPGRLIAMNRAARQAAEETYCWEKAAPTLVAAVEAALSTPPAFK